MSFDLFSRAAITSALVPASITVTSSSLGTGGSIPVDFTCDGKNSLPAMTWSSPPTGTRSLVVIIDDADAPGALFTHFIAFNVPPETRGIKEGSDVAALGAQLGRNDFNNVQYDGPCPPKGEAHRYGFRVFALNAPLAVKEGAPRADIDAAMSAHVLGEGVATALFSH
jgi:Raf kinase inhibitor-like YbhB/YbcL family protein